MSKYEIISSTIAIISVIINTGLWIIALKNIVIAHKENVKHDKNLNSESIYNIVQSHQNIYLTILQNKKYMEMLNTNDGEEEARNILSTVIINHCWAVYCYAKNELLDSDTFLGMENDIAEIFELPLIEWRWKRVKKYYSIDFQEFISHVSENGRRPNITGK